MAARRRFNTQEVLKVILQDEESEFELESSEDSDSEYEAESSEENPCEDESTTENRVVNTNEHEHSSNVPEEKNKTQLKTIKVLI